MSEYIYYSLLPKYHIVEHDSRVILIGANDVKFIVDKVKIRILITIRYNFLDIITLMNEVGKEHPHPYVLFAINQLEKEGIIIGSEQVVNYNYVPFEHVNKLPSLNWKFCQKHQIPVISIINGYSLNRHVKDYKKCLEDNKNWLPILFYPGCVLIGPVFQKDISPCPQCLEFRLKQNNSLYTWLESKTYKNVQIEKTSSILVKKTWEVLKRFSYRWKPNRSSYHEIISIGINANISINKIFQRPECSFCGNPDLIADRMNSPVILSNQINRKKIFSGYRSKTPSQTWKELKHLLHPVTGIITDFKSLTNGQDSIFHVYQAEHATIPTSEEPSPDEFSIFSFGKGTSAIASKVSALCESIERVSFRFQGNEPVVKSTIEGLRPYTITPEKFQHFHPHQLLNPSTTHALGPVPRPIFPDEIIEWLPAWSLTYNERRYIPLDAVLYGQPKPDSQRIAVFESNGLSAGNTVEEAITQGLFELIERDCVAIWWFNKLRRPLFSTKCLTTNKWFNLALNELKDHGCNVHFLDLTLDTQIPVVASIGVFDDRFLVGYGSHLDPKVAILRALTELIQVKAVMNPVSPPAVCRDVDFLYPDSKAKKIKPLTFKPQDLQGASSNPSILINKLKTLGLDTIVLNCTRPDISLPVVKVVVPGLRSLRPRFGEGRLYDIPISIGLLNVRKNYEELNPLWLTIQPFIN